MLSLRGVYAGYGGGDVLRGVDFDVETGSIVCIIGPNGAGKSTVLRVVSGLLRARLGSVLLDGTPIEKLGTAAVLARGVAQVPQTQALFPQMTVAENVRMGGYIIRRDRALLDERFEAVAAMIPVVRERAHQRAGNLSGGQRRMVEIARCLMLQPSVLLLDEPSLGLDPKSLLAVSSLIHAANEAGATLLLVEQNVRLGLQMASHGVVMESGVVRLTGTSKEISDNPEMAELYLGGSVESEKQGTALSSIAGDAG